MTDFGFSLSRSGDGALALFHGPEGTVSLRLRMHHQNWLAESAGVHVQADSIITWGVCPWVKNGQCHYTQIPVRRLITPVQKWARKEDNTVLEKVMRLWYADYTGKEYLGELVDPI